MSEHAHIAVLEHKVDCALVKIDAALNALHVLLRYAMESNMSKLHDDLLALASEVDTAADRVIAAKTEGESQLSDVLTKFEAVRDKLNTAATDNAGSGSSTGAGSGSGTTG